MYLKDNIFDDEFMNEMMMNEDLYGLDESDEESQENNKDLLSSDDIENQDDFEAWQRFCQ